MAELCLGQVSSLEMAPGRGWAEGTQGQPRQRGEGVLGVWGERAHLGGCQWLRACPVPSFQLFRPFSHPAEQAAPGCTLATTCLPSGVLWGPFEACTQRVPCTEPPRLPRPPLCAWDLGPL